MAIALDTFRQCFFIPKPTLTEDNLPDQTGRVFIVTGGYTGCGKELCKILYQHNGTVYMAGRSPEKGDRAIAELKEAFPSSDGQLKYLKLDLANLPTIKASADEFLRLEQRLDVLTNNAGVMMPPVGSKSEQDYELQMGTNCLGPYLFTEYLTPLLQKTAASSPSGSVRVTWAASLGTMGSPKHGVAWDKTTGGPQIHNKPTLDYSQTKAANVLLAKEFETRFGKDGIVSNAWNPGNLNTELTRHMSWMQATLTRMLCYAGKYGAYTELWAGWSDEAGKEENRGKYIGPWGRVVMLRKDVENTPYAKQFWEWCKEETSRYKS